MRFTLERVAPIFRNTAEIEGRFGLRRFAQNAGILSLNSVASFMRAVITAKLFAVTLGPSTVGVLAQLFNFSALMAAILPLGLTTGVSKLVAESAGDQREVNRVVLTSSVISLVSGLIGAVVLTRFTVPISSALTGSTQFAVPVLLLIWSFPLYNLAAVFSFHLQGLAAIKRFTRAGVLTTGFAAITVIPLTLVYGLTGAIASVLATSVAQTAFFGFELWRAYAARAWKFAGAQFSSPIAIQLLRFGGILLTSAVVSWASVLIVRTMTLHQLGQEANGLYQVVFGLSTQYITIFMTWMGAYVFPRLAAERSAGRVGSLLNSGLRANLALMVPILVVSIALRDPLIRIFYSSAFAAAAPMIPIQVFGDYFRIVGWSYGIALFAIGRTRAHLLVIASQAVVWVTLAPVLVPAWGLNAVPIAYSLSFLTYPLLGIGLMRRWTADAPDRRSTLLVAAGLACIAVSLAPMYIGVIAAPVMPGLVYWLNRHELRTVPIET